MFRKKKDVIPPSKGASQPEGKKPKISLPTLSVPPLWVSLPIAAAIASLSAPTMMHGNENLGVLLVTAGFLLAVGMMMHASSKDPQSEYNTQVSRSA